MSKENKKRLVCEIDEELHHKAKVKAYEERTTLTDKIIEFLKRWTGTTAVILMLTASACDARQDYNAMSGKWETRPDNVDTTTQYNAMTGEWSNQPQGSTPEYNAMSGRWDWSSGMGNDE